MVLRDRINKRINQEFEKHGIEIPFPQRDLHIKSNVVQTQDLVLDKGRKESSGRHIFAEVG
jgi:small-conductance mechanosensitive channel